MPKAFTRCVKSGGRVRTIRRGGKKYQHLCIKGSKVHKGHVKKKKA